MAKQPKKHRSTYNDHELCIDIAQAELSMEDIAKKHKISRSGVYKLASGQLRPEIKEEIDGLVGAAVEEAKRIFRAQARKNAVRLLRLAHNQDKNGQPLNERNLDISYKATVKALEFAGLSAEISADAEGSNGPMTFIIKHK